MKLKELEGHLQQVTPFSEFDYMLEQYPTSPHLAARMLFTISSVYDDIEEKVVGDFGCGGGMLGLGAAMLGAGAVLGIDIDPKAIALARRNARELDLVEETDFFLVDMARWAAAREQAGAGEGGGRGGEAGRAGEDGGSGDAAGGAVDDGGAGAAAGPVVGDAPSPPRSPLPAPLDTVVMNPPFGTRHKGIDAVFLRHALRCVRQGGAVYSLHKSTTRAHLFAVGLQLGAMPELVAELRFDIPKMYAFHTQASADVAVDLLRFEAGGGPAHGEVSVPEYVPPEGEGGEEEGDYHRRGGGGRRATGGERKGKGSRGGRGGRGRGGGRRGQGGGGRGHKKKR